MQNSACFVGTINLNLDRVKRLKELVVYLVKRCRVQVFYFSSANYFDANIYKIISSIRKRNKTFSRVVFVPKAKTFGDIFKKYEDYKISPNTTFLQIEKEKILLSTYVVVLANSLLSDFAKTLYLYAKETKKEVLVFS